MTSSERSLARKVGTCIHKKDSCATCNCPARARVACLLTGRVSTEFLETHDIPNEVADIIKSLPRDVFDFAGPQDDCGHEQRWIFLHPVLHVLGECPDDDL